MRLELTTELAATCFQDKLLIRQLADTIYVAESEGIEPSQVHENCLSRIPIAIGITNQYLPALLLLLWQSR